jgi:hypothetical protein
MAERACTDTERLRAIVSLARHAASSSATIRARAIRRTRLEAAAAAIPSARRIAP